jgi:hypothetical protein
MTDSLRLGVNSRTGQIRILGDVLLPVEVRWQVDVGRNTTGNILAKFVRVCLSTTLPFIYGRGWSLGSRLGQSSGRLSDAPCRSRGKSRTLFDGRSPGLSTSDCIRVQETVLCDVVLNLLRRGRDASVADGSARLKSSA